MAITTYGELKAAVLNRSRRSDLADDVPDFIRAAHDLIVGRLSLAASLSFTDGTETLPADFRQVEVLILENYPSSPLTQLSARQAIGFGSGVPQFYAITGSDLTVHPTPDATYNGKLLYKIERAMFDDDADTNTALDRYPFLYLYGAMAELFAHTRNIDQESKYRQLFAAGLDEANAAEQDDLYGSATLQSRSQGVV